MKKNIETKIARSLLSLGISPGIKGFRYLIKAISLCVSNDMPRGSFSKDIYPKIAKSYRTSSSSVERAVRHAISTGWARHDQKICTSIFGNSISGETESPSNVVFISAVSEWLRLHLDDE
ncbi:MAG: sporulation initiation factor Spo0A C-terminal domain-containing protein [Ruminococcus sp.]|nr:sporulation initiation factor Spo0A C-terminal domain-containing protein [Ruminococcus sp.]